MKFTSLLFRTTAGALILASAATASAQSLADVARREEERRKAVRTPGKVYTNDALIPDPGSTGAAPTAPPAAQPAAPPTPSAGAPAAPAPDAPAPAGEAPRTEADWRKIVAAERDALSRSQIFAEALQTRINALYTDFVNRADPAQRDGIAADRLMALAELDRVKQEIQQHQKAIVTLQEQARRAGVPAGWTR